MLRRIHKDFGKDKHVAQRFLPEATSSSYGLLDRDRYSAQIEDSCSRGSAVGKLQLHEDGRLDTHLECFAPCILTVWFHGQPGERYDLITEVVNEKK